MLTDDETSTTEGLSRRHALLAATLLSAPLGACRAKARVPDRSGNAAASNLAGGVAPPSNLAGGAASAWGGLSVATVSSPRAGAPEDERGGTAVVLLHGWGAPGDDLVSLAEELAREGRAARFFVPAAPLVERGGGRAWWHLDPTTRPPHANSDRLGADFRPSPAVVAARTAVQGVLATIRERYAPTRLALVGFSQGAMLAIDVALGSATRAEAVPVDGVVAMSGVLVSDAVPALRETAVRRPRFFLSHGRHDHVVPFAGGRLAAELLEKHGFPTTFWPFDGDHEIPPALVREAGRFLFAS